MGVKSKLEHLLPLYTHIPLVSMVCVHGLVYYATRLVTQTMTHFDFSLPVDGAIPFVPAFSVIYLLAFVQWTMGYILIARDSRELCCRIISGEIFSKLICMVLFLLVPTTMKRAEIVSDGLFDRIVGEIYRLDAADNFFPSIHCLESWVCFRGAMQMKKTGPWYRYFTLLFSILVFASTVLIKQHASVDIAGGVLTAEIGQQIAQRIAPREWKLPFLKRDRPGGPS